MALDYLRKEQPQETLRNQQIAIKSLDSVLTAEPNNGLALEQLGAAYIVTGDALSDLQRYSNALVAFERAKSRLPGTVSWTCDCPSCFEPSGSSRRHCRDQAILCVESKEPRSKIVQATRTCTNKMAKSKPPATHFEEPISSSWYRMDIPKHLKPIKLPRGVGINRARKASSDWEKSRL